MIELQLTKKTKKLVNQNKLYQPLIYTITTLLYTVRASLFGGLLGGLITRGLFGLFFVFSVYYFFKANKLEGKNKVCRWLNVLVVLVMIYGIIFAYVGADPTWLKDTTPFFFFHSYLESILPIYAFYYFSKKGWVDKTWFIWITPLFIGYAAYCFIVKRNEIAEEMMHINLEFEVEEYTNNAGYVVLALFPVLSFFRKRPIVYYALILSAFLLIISSAKRGAILLGALCLLYSLYDVTKGMSFWKRIVVLVSFAASIYVAWDFFNDMIQSNDRFYDRIEELREGTASNREDMYPEYFDFYLHSDWPHFVFGHGASATCRYLGLMAHNDWLEMLINMGLIGFFVLLAYWLNIFKLWIKSRSQIETDLVMAMGMFIIIYFGKTIFSMSIMDMSVVATSVFGYCLSCCDKCDKTKIKKAVNYLSENHNEYVYTLFEQNRPYKATSLRPTAFR